MDHSPPDERPGLHENAQEALQFLALGAGIVLLLRLVAIGLGLWNGNADGELEQAMAPFRNGYPLIGRDVVVLGGLAVIPRIAVALLFVLLCGVLWALFTWTLGRVLGWNGLRSAVIGSRAGLLLGGVWAVYCLLCLPPRQTQVNAVGFTRTERPAFLHTIPVPFAARTTHWGHRQIEGYEVLEQYGQDGRTSFVVVARIGDRMEPVASHVEGEGDLDVQAHRQRAEAGWLAAALDALNHSK